MGLSAQRCGHPGTDPLNTRYNAMHPFMRNWRVGATSDGRDMVQPPGVGAERLLHAAGIGTGRQTQRWIAIHRPRQISTPIGDLTELQAIQKVFPENPPLVSSTKSPEWTFPSAPPRRKGFIPYASWLCQCQRKSGTTRTQPPPCLVLRSSRIIAGRRSHSVNSFGFGTNASLLFRRAPRVCDVELIAEGLG